jgi:glycosyl hydrolase family 123
MARIYMDRIFKMKKTLRRGVGVVVGLMVVGLWVMPCQAQHIPPEENVILSAKCFWRIRMIWETEEVVLPDGKVLHGGISTKGKDYSWTNGAGRKFTFSASRSPVRRLPEKNAADWMAPDFDDSVWARFRGPFFRGSANHNWKLIQLRNLFTVDNVRQAGTPSLNMTFYGGVVVYLNGKEVTHAFMPEGPVDVTTPALGYPQDVYLDAKGKAIKRGSYRVSEETKAKQAKRWRKIENFEIPNKMLQKGVNVLAVAIHRAPTDYGYYLQGRSPHKETRWAKIGLSELELIAQPGAAIVPNLGPAPSRTGKGVQFETGPLKGLGFHLRNQSVIQRVFLRDYPDAYSKVKPVQVAGVRNGTFAAQFLVGHGQEEIRGLKVKISDLKGPGTILSSAVKIRYARLNGNWFDVLDDTPPRDIPMYKEHGAALQPVWLNVGIPADAKPGDYAGTITVTADHEKPLTLPLHARVMGWTLPDSKDLSVAMDVIQSPESVAMAYNVPLWSDKHFKLLGETFSLLSALGDKTIYITCVRRTHFGNEHAMVRWTRDDEGDLQPDFTIVKKYLDTAMKHMGKIPGVILYGWEPPYSQGHAGGTGGAARTHDRPILFSLYDPETGDYSAARGPAWGTDEARAFWKKLTDGIQPVLKKRGLQDSMLFGLLGDHRPSKQAMDDTVNGVPGGKWAVHSHLYCRNWKGHPMGLTVALWGVGYRPSDPSRGLSFGWSNPRWLCYYPREMSLSKSTLVEYRTKIETYVGAIGRGGGIQKGSGVRGLGRLGADFWSVLKDSRGRPRGSLAGRYPESAWGQLNLNFGIPHLLGRGQTRPVPTVRSEAFREAVQELQARVYVEKALLDDRGPALLGADLVARCRRTLDERIRVYLQAGGEGKAWFISSDWRDRAEQLFRLAAEAKKKYGDKDPVPNLVSKTKKK